MKIISGDRQEIQVRAVLAARYTMILVWMLGAAILNANPIVIADVFPKYGTWCSLSITRIAMASVPLYLNLILIPGWD